MRAGTQEHLPYRGPLTEPQRINKLPYSVPTSLLAPPRVDAAEAQNSTCSCRHRLIFSTVPGSSDQACRSPVKCSVCALQAPAKKWYVLVTNSFLPESTLLRYQIPVQIYNVTAGKYCKSRKKKEIEIEKQVPIVNISEIIAKVPRRKNRPPVFSEKR